ncbi:PhzF family phenazine biosynthesis protein [Herbidospora mongoliensis]|uniref:PhzF family phenazine biosynthesis protein n=1 Tax=Herbidospora mongoliensis TaxID=688067 RepID=UPI000830CE0B|nr:PhzF family phenazine biosynthesis isomerase [Herbidospora mongoliensis]
MILRYAAFTTDPSGGNPAGVVLDATGHTDAEMLAVAADLGYSETAFLFPEGGSRYTIRYFSPLAEVAFCGHATIATSVALGEVSGSGTLHLTTKAGPVDVDVVAEPNGPVTATLTSPPASTRAADPADVTAALNALGYAPGDLDPAYPVHVANAGMNHLILGLTSRELLAGLDYDFEALGALMAARDWITVNLFWAESPLIFHARNPFPPGGVVEDPATGAAAAAFTGYLRDLALIKEDDVVTIHQGADMGRPSLLTAAPLPDDQRIRVSGRAVRFDSEP